MNVLCIGDIVGDPGLEAVRGLIDDAIAEHSIDFIVANAENVAGGVGAGLTTDSARELLDRGCHVLTLGDHVWDQKELEPFLDESPQLIRPANFAEGSPGRGFTITTIGSDTRVAVVHLVGRMFMRFQANCPFRQIARIVEELEEEAPIILVEIHAETTGEKLALGHFLDGQVSAVWGTHTHVQTADEKILPKGTAYISDLGMTGAQDSVLGAKKEMMIERYWTARPVRFQLADRQIELHGIVMEIDEQTGSAQSISRIQLPLQSQ